ncbi:MAG: transposase family protein [Elusimicrobia bacterium]|nr:transposase family protein [Elusimicrobiota bacterium]
MQQIYLHSYFKKGELYNLSKIGELINHPKRAEIARKIKIIDFFDKHGWKITKEAFGVGRSTIYLWKSKIREREGDIKALAGESKRPHKLRKRKANILIEEFIIRYRKEHYRAGKGVIKVELDEYCRVNGINLISISTIGRIIKELKERGLIENDKKVSFNARTGKIIIKKVKKKKKERRKGYIPLNPGDLVQIDTLDIFLDGVKRYIINGIDIKTRFGFGYMYEKLNSLNAKDFLKRFSEVAPFEIKRIQTDNGSEFEKYFDNYIKRNKLIHYFNYPHHPQSNAYVERFNRTIKEQYVYSNYDRIENIEKFNRGLMEYLLWYNTIKPHNGIENKSPLKYYLDNFINNSKKSNMLWTLTNT